MADFTKTELASDNLSSVTGGSADEPHYCFKNGMCYEDLVTPYTIYRVHVDYTNVPGNV